MTGLSPWHVKWDEFGYSLGHVNHAVNKGGGVIMDEQSGPEYMTTTCTAFEAMHTMHRTVFTRLLFYVRACRRVHGLYVVSEDLRRD